MSESNPPQLSTSTRLLLDTNVAIDFINKPSIALARMAPGTAMYVSSVILGELFFGARNSSRLQVNLANVEHFAAAMNMLMVDTGTARLYGEIRKSLETKGRRILENDIWIAATAILHSLPLATRDSHFDYVDGLKILPW